MSGMSNKAEAKSLFFTQVKKPNLNSAFSHQSLKLLQILFLSLTNICLLFVIGYRADAVSY